MPKKKTPKQLFNEKVKFLEDAEQRLGIAARSYERKLFELLVTEYLPLLETKDGIILDSANNDKLIAEIDRYFDKLEKALYKDVLGGFASNLIKSAEFSARYYTAMGFKKKVVNELLKNKVRLEGRIGITPTGRLRKGTYLYDLGKTAQVRQQLKNYVLTSLTGDVSFLDFQLGLRNLVIGNKRVKGLAVNGALQKYFDQYAYDKFNELDAIANKQLAEGLNLEHMVYEGGLIETSRRFCRKYAGKAFIVKEWVKLAKKDPHLVEPRTRSSYNPLVERGRYRCRHFIRYITKTVYLAMKKAEQAA